MAGYWWWFIAAAVLIGAELLTGTFYLLAVGAAVAVGGVLALAGFEDAWQFGLTAVCVLAFMAVAHHWRTAIADKSGPPMALDVGKQVAVESWGESSNARVSYRGSTWDAVLASPQVPRNPHLYIVEGRGSGLLLSDQPPARTD
jgi:membrane protein implicated in regulation of membrane protease activity